MPAHSRPKDGVASLAYVAGIHVFLRRRKQDVDARHKAGHDVERAISNDETSAQQLHQVGLLLCHLVERALLGRFVRSPAQ
jgi:hypothetical protein